MAYPIPTEKLNNLRMSEEDTISEFNGKLWDMANGLFTLEEKTP